MSNLDSAEPPVNLEQTTDEAIGKAAKVSADSIENAAAASLNYVDRLIEFAPWLEFWYAKVAVVLLIGLVLLLLKSLLFKGLIVLLKPSSMGLRYNVLVALQRPFRWFIYILCFEVSRLILMDSFTWSGFAGLRFVSAALLIWTVAIFVADMLTQLEFAIHRKRERDGEDFSRSSLKAGMKFLRLVVYILASMFVLSLLGFSLAGLLAFGGLGGVIVGMAAKDMLSNFFGALMVYMDKPFRVGDWVRSPDRSIEGVVEEIGWRVTRIRTFDKRPLYVPNSVFTTITLENPSQMSNRRIYETLGIRYDDMETVETIVNEIRQLLQQHPDIDQQGTLIVNLNAFSAYSVDIMVYCFTKTTDWVLYHAIKQDVLLNIERIIRANRAEIAFPTTTMHIKGEGAVPQLQ